MRRALRTQFDVAPAVVPCGKALNTARMHRRLKREAAAANAGIVPYPTNRVLTRPYFEDDDGQAEPYLFIMDSVYTHVHIEVVPMWTSDASGKRVVCGHYFLPYRDPENGLPRNRDAAVDGEARQKAMSAEDVANEITEFQTPVISLFYRTWNDRKCLWEKQEAPHRLSVIAQLMGEKNLKQGNKKLANDIIGMEFGADASKRLSDFRWPEGVDFVSLVPMYNIIEIKPTALARYIREGGQLW